MAIGRHGPRFQEEEKKSEETFHFFFTLIALI
jgi:hypothetical protein